MGTVRYSVFSIGRFVLLLALAAVCTVVSMAFLTALCVAIPLLAEQIRAWLAGGTWTAFPLSALLERIGYRPHADWPLLQNAVAWLLSLEAGPLVLFGAATVYGAALWTFESVGRKVLKVDPATTGVPVGRAGCIADMRPARS